MDVIRQNMMALWLLGTIWGRWLWWWLGRLQVRLTEAVGGPTDTTYAWPGGASKWACGPVDACGHGLWGVPTSGQVVHWTQDQGRQGFAYLWEILFECKAGWQMVEGRVVAAMVQSNKKVVICIPSFHIPVVYQSKLVISCSLWHWLHHWYNEKNCTTVHISDIFLYTTHIPK